MTGTWVRTEKGFNCMGVQAAHVMSLPSGHMVLSLRAWDGYKLVLTTPEGTEMAYYPFFVSMKQRLGSLEPQVTAWLDEQLPLHALAALSEEA